MRTARHQVAPSPFSDFAYEIGRRVHSYSRAGLVTDREWALISEALLDHLGALSVSAPALDSPEAKAVLADAAEAAAASVSFCAFHPRERFHVFLPYVNFGTSYDPGGGGSPAAVSADRWVDAFCLAVLTDTVSRHGEAFVFTWQSLSPADDLVTGLLALLVTGVDLPAPTPDPALRAVHALAARDREAFDATLHTLLSGLSGPHPRSLLPLLPLALSALAYRRHGWLPSLDTDYLPLALVTNFEAPGRDAVTWPVRLPRPTPPFPLHPGYAARCEESIRRATAPSTDNPRAVADLADALSDQTRLIRARASHSADVTDAQLAEYRRASQIGAALFRLALAEPGSTVDVTIDGRTAAFPATRDDSSHPGRWHAAVDFALISGAPEDLAPLVLAGPALTRHDRSAHAAYRRALHDHLRGAEPDIEPALREAEFAGEQGFPPPPAALLARLVEGDESGFNLALLDALEAHRDHYSVADRPTGLDATIDLRVLALACHARRRGWAIRVESPYLPARLLREAGCG
ncbi:immunity 49 family protein [Kitasatospora sp. NPDC094028]